MLLVGIAVAGGAGALARALLDAEIRRRVEPSFPVGILVVNVSGSLLLGVISGLALYHGLPATPRTVLGTGFCGGYTTFSTFAFETVSMLETHRRRGAYTNLALTLLLPALAAGAGLALASL